MWCVMYMYIYILDNPFLLSCKGLNNVKLCIMIFAYAKVKKFVESNLIRPYEKKYTKYMWNDYNCKEK